MEKFVGLLLAAGRHDGVWRYRDGPIKLTTPWTRVEQRPRRGVFSVAKTFAIVADPPSRTRPEVCDLLAF